MFLFAPPPDTSMEYSVQLMICQVFAFDPKWDCFATNLFEVHQFRAEKGCEDDENNDEEDDDDDHHHHHHHRFKGMPAELVDGCNPSEEY